MSQFDKDNTLLMYNTLDESVTSTLSMLQGYYRQEGERIRYILESIDNINKWMLMKQFEQILDQTQDEMKAKDMFYDWVLSILDNCGPRPISFFEREYFRRAG